MMQKRMKKILNKRGFTLIELVVVIAILGILAMVAIPRFVGQKDLAQHNANIATATTIVNAAEVYYVDKGTEPTVALLQPNYLRTGTYTGYTLSGSAGTYACTYPAAGTYVAGSVGG